MALADILKTTELVFDPLFKYMYIVELPDFNMTPSYVQGISCPLPTINGITQLQAGYRIHYPTLRSLSVDTLEIRLYEDQTLPCLDWFMKWSDKVVTGTSDPMFRNNFYPPLLYKRDVVVYPINSDGLPVCALTYHGCYPATSNGYDFDIHGWSSYISPTVALYVDTMDITWLAKPDLDSLLRGSLQQLGTAPGVLVNAGVQMAGLDVYSGAISAVASNINPSYQPAQQPRQTQQSTGNPATPAGSPDQGATGPSGGGG